MPAAPAAREKRAFIEIAETDKPRRGGFEERL
jgi:hypothetical protein